MRFPSECPLLQNSVLKYLAWDTGISRDGKEPDEYNVLVCLNKEDPGTPEAFVANHGLKGYPKADVEEEGLALGKEEGKLETARAMKADNVPVETICRYTGLSEQEVAEL